MIEIENPLTNAYKTFPGPVLLLAGPGTGKTYQLAMRIKFLVDELDAKPNEIAIITFTVEAARNMREGLSHEDADIPVDRHPEVISTMHSLGNAVVGSCTGRFSLPENYGVLNHTRKQTLLLQDAASLAGLERDKWTLAAECRRNGNCNEDLNEEKCRICKEYKNILRKCSLIDYDDQILLACELLRSDAKLKEKWKAKTRYLLVDEYQDINQAQCDLIQLLSEGQTDGLFVVGDDDQSIYSFRGGNPKYIQDFDKYFEAETKIGMLSKSWRCPEHILRGAQAMVASFNSNRVPKPEPTFSSKIKTNEKVYFHDVPSADFEAWLISEIAMSKVVCGDDIIIIVPNSNYTAPLKRQLDTAGLEYKYRSRLSEDGLDRFTALVEWAEDQSCNSTLRYLLDLAINNYDELTKQFETAGAITAKREAASQFVASMWNAVNVDKPLYQVMSEHVETDGSSFLNGLLYSLRDVSDLLIKEGGTRLAMEPFLQQCGLLLAPGKSPKGIMREVCDWKKELLGSSKSSSFKPVQIYNMQSAKGLEADIVLVVGLSEELFPRSDENIEELSRLFFVAMTRTKKELHLFNARLRSGDVTFGKSYQLKRSRFIDAIPAEHVEYNYVKQPKKKS